MTRGTAPEGHCAREGPSPPPDSRSKIHASAAPQIIKEELDASVRDSVNAYVVFESAEGVGHAVADNGCTAFGRHLRIDVAATIGTSAAVASKQVSTVAAYCLLLTAYCLLLSAYCLLLAAASWLLTTPYSLLPAPWSILPISPRHPATLPRPHSTTSPHPIKTAPHQNPPRRRARIVSHFSILTTHH